MDVGLRRHPPDALYEAVEVRVRGDAGVVAPEVAAPQVDGHPQPAAGEDRLPLLQRPPEGGPEGGREVDGGLGPRGRPLVDRGAGDARAGLEDRQLLLEL